MEPVYDRAQLLLERNQPNDVLALISPELTKNFSDVHSLELLGHAYYQRGEYGLAANFYKQAHCIYPTVDVLINLGACFKQIDDMKNAQECWEMALEMGPKPHQRSGLLANIAGCWTANGTPDKALDYYRQSLKADPSNKIAAYNMCWPYLETRDWANGFPAYDSGFFCGTRQLRTYDEVPTWRPGMELKGDVIVWGDQGLGDEIMAASCIPDLIKHPGIKSVVFDCHPRLKGMFSRSFGIECTGTRKTGNIEWFRNRRFDLSIPITSLLTLFRSNGEWPGTPYLKPPEINKTGKFRVGISWAGGVASTRAHVRSMPLKDLEPLFRAIDADWYSLQYHETASAEVCRFEESSGIHIKHFPSKLLAYDYDETAALVGSLDLLITVCTSVMHLAGAMGIPTWVMTPNRPPWVMGIEGDDLPMYRSARQFRQAKGETGWSSVLDAMITAFNVTPKAEAAE